MVDTLFRVASIEIPILASTSTRPWKIWSWNREFFVSSVVLFDPAAISDGSRFFVLEVWHSLTPDKDAYGEHIADLTLKAGIRWICLTRFEETEIHGVYVYVSMTAWRWTCIYSQIFRQELTAVDVCHVLQKWEVVSWSRQMSIGKCRSYLTLLLLVFPPLFLKCFMDGSRIFLRPVWVCILVRRLRWFTHGDCCLWKFNKAGRYLRLVPFIVQKLFITVTIIFIFLQLFGKDPTESYYPEQVDFWVVCMWTSSVFMVGTTIWISRITPLDDDYYKYLSTSESEADL